MKLKCVLVLFLALAGSACQVSVNGKPYDCVWTDQGVSCAPLEHAGRE